MTLWDKLRDDFEDVRVQTPTEEVEMESSFVWGKKHQSDKVSRGLPRDDDGSGHCEDV